MLSRWGRMSLGTDDVEAMEEDEYWVFRDGCWGMALDWELPWNQGSQRVLGWVGCACVV